MAFWWVNHKQTYQAEIEGGYIWSPKTNSNNSFNQTYINLTKAKPTDIIFSYANGRIASVGVVTAQFREQKRPSEFGSVGDSWAGIGWAVPIEWTKLENPIIPKNHIDKIAPLLPTKNSPLQQNGKGNQICYLASISNELGNFLIGLTKEDDLILPETLSDIQNELEGDEKEEEINSRSIDQTEKDQLVKARRGQGLFKLNLLDIEKECRITNVSDKSFLIASHIKPWKDSNDLERLDGNNGLLLSPHVDKLFDRGWISFSDVGEILCINPKILEIMNEWGINPKKKVGVFNAVQCKYLDYHREEVYKKRNKLK